MSSENSIKIADNIIKDLKGAGYYRDPKILAAYLQGKLVKTKTSILAKEVALAILEDFRGAKYYNDPEILADFLGD